MKSQAILFFMALLGVVACNPPSTPTPEPKVSDVWVYRFIDYDESGTIVNTYDHTFTGVGGPDDTYVTLEDTSALFSPSIIPRGTYRMNTDGLYHVTNFEVGGVPRFFLKYPGAVGDNYPWTTSTSGVNLADVSITSTNDTATVPYGFFSGLYKYEADFTLSPTLGNIWFNDSVWFVKYEVFDSLTVGTGMYMDYSYGLVSYTAH
jgi:hypothetical protein